METANYRKWIPAFIIGLILCLPVITWLLTGTSEPPPAGRPANAAESPSDDEPL